MQFYYVKRLKLDNFQNMKQDFTSTPVTMVYEGVNSMLWILEITCSSRPFCCEPVIATGEEISVLPNV